MRINFISNLDLSETSGGWSGINAAIFQQLSAHFETTFVGPINPVTDYPAKLVSKLQRLRRNQGSFHFFSERRLRRIALGVAHGIKQTATCDFFQGVTPWIHYESPRPYFVYVDTCFSTYVDVYHDRSQFLPGDLKRISAKEAKWLAGAARVFFGTEWALEKAASDYHLPHANLCAVGAAGSMTPPDKDAYQGGMKLLFIALNFEKKGGRMCAEAFSQMRTKFPGARLTIVGERPPSDILNLPGISYAGFLRKSVPAELKKLESLYANAFALIHPTSADIQPLVISEAGYYGCPSIAAKSFGIPELIVDRVTGILIDTPLTAEAFADSMLDLASAETRYVAMRKAARTHATKNLTWPAVGDRIISEMTSALGFQ